MTYTDAPQDPETRQFVRVWVEVQDMQQPAQAAEPGDDIDTALPVAALIVVVALVVVWLVLWGPR